jgi:hypothetical protein
MTPKLRVAPKDDCSRRIMAVKPLLPKGYKTTLFENYPEYNTAKGSALVNNVLRLNSTDMRITEILEQLAADHKKAN